MNKTVFVVVVICLVQLQALAQSEELPKFEVAAEFTTLEREAFSQRRTEPGLGGRFTFNLNKTFSLEAAGYFFPKSCFQCRNAGTISQGLAGVKAGKRFEKWGVFAKARPGVISFSQGTFDIRPPVNFPLIPIGFELSRLTTFAMDVGGVVEIYPTKRIVTRFDVGDTIVHFGRRTIDTVIFDPQTNTVTSPVTIPIPPRTSHNFQFMTSVGFRF
ncbi:MAG TPA: hypothetical protein VLB46_15245 [Pyrinomonadaceae bacterium]|nr:hypothetical protein [Pyrinomonadaceae bacterium]